MINRRKFLQQISLTSGAAIVAIGSHGWIAKSVNGQTNRQRTIVIFLRGGADGLNIVVPYGESAYYDYRPQIAIAPPGDSQGALELDDRFGLNPALAALMPLWQQGSLAFVHACGYPEATQSHFDAQKYMEVGSTNIRRSLDGWMNRLLSELSTPAPTKAVGLGATMPRILSGRMPVALLPLGRNPQRPSPIDRPQISSLFDRLYTGNDSISKAYQQGRVAREQLLRDLEEEAMAADNGAPPPKGFAVDARKMARIMVKDPSTQLGFLDLGGWDTHVNQGKHEGQLGRNLKSLGEGLAVLVQELGDIYSQTAIVVMSEFGRTARENGNGGTDHGSGNVMWLLGGSLKGRKVYGEWPGLSESQLLGGRYLKVTTDYRDVLASVLTQHMELNPEKLSAVLPGYSSSSKMVLF
ncbi:MAG: DUF1501 domain-containing protein [Cyanosarcina radialis HA8281-LM2]|jgi:uncharacterized protein (DUF1501 family)|nr:DUF1501 domain-containing protein [Cyanosarcina radialis HA8281-LM2]